MVTLRNDSTGAEIQLCDNELDLILEALVHGMERYNDIMNMSGDKGIRDACTDAKRRVSDIYRRLCKLLDD